MIRNFIELNKKLLVAIALTEVARGIFIIVAAFTLSTFLDTILNGSDSPTLVASYFAMLVARIVVENFRSKQFLRLSALIVSTVRHKIHAALFDHGARPIDAGELLHLAFDVTASLDNFIVRVLPTILSLTLLTPLILIVSTAIDPPSALIFLATLPIAPFLLYLIGRAVGVRNARAQTILVELNSDFDELLRAIPTLKLFRRTKPALEKLRAESERASEAILDVLRLAFVSAFALELITTLAIALVAVTCGLRLTAGSIEFRAAFFILLLAPEFFAPIRQLGAAFHSFIDARQSLDKLKHFLAADDAVLNRSTDAFRVPPSVSLRNVSFTYPDKTAPTLRKINLELEAGKITAIKGESGSGKTTLLKLLAGLEAPTSGEIFISDLPMSKMERQSIVSKIAYVPQQPHYFNASFADNASAFRDCDPIRLKTLADELHISEHNVRSRGQLQRLGLLRALLKVERGASIVILDEPTAGLDLETEKIIVEAIKKAGRRRTVVIAAHRPAVIELADRIIDLDELGCDASS